MDMIQNTFVRFLFPKILMSVISYSYNIGIISQQRPDGQARNDISVRAINPSCNFMIAAEL